MDLESKPTNLGPEPQVLVASSMLTPSYRITCSDVPCR